MKDFAHLVKRDLAGVLLGLGIRVECLEATLQDQVDLGDFHIKDVLQSVLDDLF